MSDCGLCNLDTLKRHLLAASLVADTTWDTTIAEIGAGVARSFDKFTNRKLAYAAGDTITFSADRDHFYLPRFPVVSVSLTEQKDDETTGYVTLTDAYAVQDLPIGKLIFGSTLGTWQSVVRVTYTGGYWFDTKEPTDNGYPTTMPTGATALDGALKLAFLLQCAHVWDSRDKLGLGIGDKPGARSALADLNLVPEVKNAMQGFIRYQIT